MFSSNPNDDVVAVRKAVTPQTFSVPPATAAYYNSLDKKSLDLFFGVVKSLAYTDKRKGKRGVKVEAAYQELKKKGSIGNCTHCFLSNNGNLHLDDVIPRVDQVTWFYKLMQYDYMLSMSMSVAWGYDYDRPTRVLTVVTVHMGGTVTTTHYPLT
jgi:hypothetical protein